MAEKIEEKIILNVLSTLNEAQARWYIAEKAISLGRGGLKRIHELTGLSRPTILNRDPEPPVNLTSGDCSGGKNPSPATVLYA